MNKIPFWKESYKRTGSPDTFGGGQPNAELYNIVKRLPHGAKVLDLGWGEGRNALFLAQNGLDVTAVDISEAGITKLRDLADHKRLLLVTEVQDMQEYMFKDSMGLGFTLALVILGSIRELLGSGSIFGYQILGSYFRPWVIMILPAGAFLTLGILIGMMNTFSRKSFRIKLLGGKPKKTGKTS